MKSYDPHVSYQQIGDRTWRVYLVGRWLGDIVRGKASALFRAPSGKTRLYRDTSDIEAALARAIQRGQHARSN